MNHARDYTGMMLDIVPTMGYIVMTSHYLLFKIVFIFFLFNSIRFKKIYVMSVNVHLVVSSEHSKEGSRMNESRCDLHLF